MASFRVLRVGLSAHPTKSLRSSLAHQTHFCTRIRRTQRRLPLLLAAGVGLGISASLTSASTLRCDGKYGVWMMILFLTGYCKPYHPPLVPPFPLLQSRL